MELNRALAQISEIHAQLLKSEVFRGYRAWPTALTGFVVLGAAALQDGLFPPADSARCCWAWLAVALLCAAICALDIGAGYLAQSSRSARRRTELALGQFAPALATGVLVTAVLMPRAPELLPGLWMLCFALGLFSSRLHLPRAIGWVALWYMLSGAQCLALSTPGVLPSPWCMGIVFGAGQLATAAVFYASLERRSDDAAQR